MPLPLAVLSGLPAVQEIGPTRFALPIQLAAAVLLALVLDRGLERLRVTHLPRPGRLLAVAAVALVALVPLLPNGPVASAALPRPGPLVGEAAEAVPAGATVLPYPYPSYATNVAMLWQIDSGMRFTMPGGEVYVPGDEGRSTNYPRSGLPPGLWSVLVPARPPYPWRWHSPGPARRRHLVAVLRTYVATHHVDAMVVSTTGAQGRWVAALARSALGRPSRVQGGTASWTGLGTRWSLVRRASEVRAQADGEPASLRPGDPGSVPRQPSVADPRACWESSG